MIKNILTIILINISILASAQFYKKQENFKFEKKNIVTFTLGGHGLFYSIGLEHVFLNYKKYKLTGSIQTSYIPKSTGYIPSWTPILLNNVFSNGKHHAEIGLGYLFTKENFNKPSLRIDNKQIEIERWNIFSLAYRHQKNTSRYMYKVAFTPIFESYFGSTEIHPLAGVTFGYTF